MKPYDQHTIILQDDQGSIAQIAPHMGGWCLSFSVQTDALGRVEVLRHVPEEVAQFPAKIRGGLPILFPIASWVKAQGQMDHYEWLGRLFALGQHGFARRMAFAVIQRSTSAVTLELKASPETRAVYPFDFVFRITYALAQGGLSTHCYFENRTAQPMPFSFGFHPYFNAPLRPSGRRNDCFVRIPAGQEFFGDADWTTLRRESREESKLSLAGDFAGTRFFGELARPEVSLEDPEADLAIRLLWDHPQFLKHFALWAPDTQSPYFCIEPWTCLPNSFARPDGIELIEPGGRRSVSLEIGVGRALPY